MSSAYGEYTSYFLSFIVETYQAVADLNRFKSDLSLMRKQYRNIGFKSGYLQKGITRWKKDISSGRGVLYKLMRGAGAEERNRAISAYQETQFGSASPEGMSAFIRESKFIAVDVKEGFMALAVGNRDELTARTSNWRDRYAGAGPTDWFPSPPPYLDEDIGYWAWQEMGAGEPRHWLKTTVAKYPENYQFIGGNINARHIFLAGAQEMHHAQTAIIGNVLQRLVNYDPWGIIKK